VAPEVKNVVFHSIEDKWRGPLPASTSEIVAGLFLGLVGAVLSNPLFGGLVGVSIIASLVVLRRLDHDRSDYVYAFLRRQMKKQGAYNGADPDLAFRRFEPR
jgi:hypothetical protein